jgi:hypothetical protein
MTIKTPARSKTINHENVCHRVQPPPPPQPKFDSSSAEFQSGRERVLENLGNFFENDLMPAYEHIVRTGLSPKKNLGLYEIYKFNNLILGLEKLYEDKNDIMMRGKTGEWESTEANKFVRERWAFEEVIIYQLKVMCYIFWPVSTWYERQQPEIWKAFNDCVDGIINVCGERFEDIRIPNPHK